MQKNFRWAYIGSGNIAYSTARSILKGNHEITAVYGRTKQRVEKFAKRVGATAYDDFDSCILAENVDGVYIATPHTAHLNYTLRALELGKPVLCEKPVAVTTKQVEAMVEKSKSTNVYFTEAMWTWFSDVALTVKNWVQNEEIGEITDVVIDYAFPGIMMSKNSRVLTPETAGGALLDIGVYPITYCYNLFGYPKNVFCDGVIKDGIDISETVILDYGTFKATLNMSLCKLQESCTINGTKGSIKLPMFHMASKAVMKNGIKRKVFRGKTDYNTEFSRVANEIKDGKIQSSYVPYRSTIDCMKIMDECRKQMSLVYPFEK